MTVLVTGGAGFVGSHFACGLRAGRQVVILDDLSGMGVADCDPQPDIPLQTAPCWFVATLATKIWCDRSAAIRRFGAGSLPARFKSANRFSETKALFRRQHGPVAASYQKRCDNRA